jgi:hypothetical protein
MRNIKRLMGIFVLVLVASLGTPQAFGNDGAVETPGRTAPVVGAVETPGHAAPISGAVETPGIAVLLLDFLVGLL